MLNLSMNLKKRIERKRLYQELVKDLIIEENLKKRIERCIMLRLFLSSDCSPESQKEN